MIDLTTHPWYYLAHYAVGPITGHLEVALDGRINTPTDIQIVRGKIGTMERADPSHVVLTGLTLISGPEERADDAEWRQERAISAQAREVVQAWAELPQGERTFIGDQLRLADLANALDGLLRAVRGA